MPAAKATEAAAQQGEFWAMHDALFENQDQWSNSGAPLPLFVTYAEEIGLDTDLFRRHMRASVIDDHINAQFQEARDLGFTGTPSFTLNGQPMQFETFQGFRDQVEAAIGVTSTTTDSASPAAGQPAAAADADVRFGI